MSDKRHDERADVGCATALFGDLSQADLVKIHKASGGSVERESVERERQRVQGAKLGLF